MAEEKQEKVQENSTIVKTRKRRPYNRQTKATRGNNENLQQEESIFKKSKLKIIPLGGLHEVGKISQYSNMRMK